MFTLIEITFMTPDGNCSQFRVGDRDIEQCLQMVNDFVKTEYLPIAILLTTGGRWHCLPIAVFDGEDWIAPIHQLQQEWEMLLLTPRT